MNANIHTAGIPVRRPGVRAAGLAALAVGMLALASPAGIAHGDPPGAAARHGHGGNTQGHGGVCGARGGWGLSRLDGTVANLIDFNPTQFVAWNDLMGTVGDARDRVRAACVDYPTAGAMAPDRLARLEGVTAARLEGLHAIRPKFDMFYATLSERQRVGLTTLMDRPHRHGKRTLHRAR